MGKATVMDAPSWPPREDHPVENWTDDELIDQYRYIKAGFAGDDSEYLDNDENVAALIQEIIRRGLDDLAEAVEEDPASAGTD